MADFFNPCCLTSPIAQIVELRTAHPTHTQHLNARQTFAIERENFLHADIVSPYFTHAKSLIHAIASNRNAHAFKILSSCFFRLL